MKSAKLGLVAAAIGLLSACGNAEQKQVDPKTEIEKQSYAIGVSMGQQIISNLKMNEEIGMSLNQSMLRAGINDALDGTVQMSEEEKAQLLDALKKQVTELVNKKKDEEAAKQKELLKEQHKDVLAEGETFLAENAKKEGVVVTESGLQYEVLTAAEGEKPSATDSVTVHYRGTLLDGSEFDSSYSRNKPIDFPLNGVIKGWTEGVQLMSVGSKFKFYIPYDLAYGERGAGADIPPFSTLIFEVELLSVNK